MSCAAQRCAAARARAALDSMMSLVTAYQQHSLHRFSEARLQLRY